MINSVINHSEKNTEKFDKSRHPSSYIKAYPSIAQKVHIKSIEYDSK